MAPEHALLVSLSERPAGGLELARRFSTSIRFFWAARQEGLRCFSSRTRFSLRLVGYPDQQLEIRDYPNPGVLVGQALDQYLVLRGGIRLEEFWVTWLDEYLNAHTPQHHRT
jgi:hypothetical protein